MVLRNAFSTSEETLLLSKHMAYSMVEASQGSVIRPSLVKPNSSWDIRRSSSKTLFPRYASGTSNRLSSAVYTTQWPLTATEEQHSSDSFAAPLVRRFLPSDVILCQFLASRAIILALVMMTSSFRLLVWKLVSSWLSLECFVCEAASDGVWRILDHEYIYEGKSWEPSQLG
ncbi:hypothetical protein BDA96_09G203500 [Sorghum bicolor]|uniref:Uncharacterized protein n=1 Tax=Sorghum bicolor TaxID=4558 RepID=A0A921QAR1_SORBI|nr:hypothetical protein BDA96_09G203500 [Sorghum bicolor]